MRIVIIESPFRGADGDYEATSLYLDYCIRSCLLRGETPYASHRMLPGALDDKDPVQRGLGINAGRYFIAAILNNISSARPFLFMDIGMPDHVFEWYETSGFSGRIEKAYLRQEDFAAYQQELRELRA